MTGPINVENTGIGKGGGIRWLPPNPYSGNGRAARFIIHMSVGLAAATKGFARQVEAYAKENAPWANRTGDARDGLKATGAQRLTTYTITLSHTASYGLWLEVRWDGKYAIILPTIETMGPRFMAELAALNLNGIARLGGG